MYDIVQISFLDVVPGSGVAQNPHPTLAAL
jgi:hypothetical protein